jgi:hypothetical protein
MVEALESRFKVEECSFNSIFGTFKGHRIYASRKVAEKIEIQTRYAAELYNVDVRQDQRYLAEKDLFPCGDRDESRFSPDFQVPLSILGIEVAGDPDFPRDISVSRYSVNASKGLRGQRSLSSPISWSSSKSTTLTLSSFPMQTHGFLSLQRRQKGSAWSPHSAAADGSSPCPQSPTGAMARSTTRTEP